MEVLDTVGAVIPIYWEIIHISSLSMGIMYIIVFEALPLCKQEFLLLIKCLRLRAEKAKQKHLTKGNIMGN